MKTTYLTLTLVCVPVTLGAQIALAGTAVGALTEYKVDAGNGVELSSGTLLGGRVTLSLGQWFEIEGVGLVGRLTADSTFAEDLDVNEGQVTASVTVLPWLALQVGGNIRSFETALARQRWTTVRLGAETRLGFVGGAVRGLLRGGLMPMTDINDMESPGFAFFAAAGLEWAGRPLTARMTYELERSNFSADQGIARRDQLSALRLSAGFRLGGT